MYYTYILRSIKTPGAIYIGSTPDLESQLIRHNSLQDEGNTGKNIPWEIESYIAFAQKKDAKKFEVFLKSGPGKDFMKKRLLSNQLREDLEKFKNARKQ